MTIQLNRRNYILYQRTINSLERSTITAAGNIFIVDGAISSTCTHISIFGIEITIVKYV